MCGSKTVNARVLSAKAMQVYEMPDVPKEVLVAVREMVSEVAAKAVAEEENISVRKSSSSASGYAGVRKLPSGRFEVRPLGTFDSAYEAAVAYGMHADEVGKPSASANATASAAEALKSYMMPGVPKEVAAAVREMVSEVAGKGGGGGGEEY